MAQSPIAGASQAIARMLRVPIMVVSNDLKAKRFYFRTYENSQIRMVDLTKQKLDGKEIVKWSMQGDEVVRDLATP